ncbi:MAG TPA: M14 family zinc carboxypeptidase [Gemmatimonadota bacterium]|nr:M14 family zinc carboxypeptidase [Gemmatimonadota bacterium]
MRNPILKRALRALLTTALLAATAASAAAQETRELQTEVQIRGGETVAEAARSPWHPDVPEAGSVEAIARWTTAPEFLPNRVAYVPESPTVPSPADVLGRVTGAPDELSSVEEIHRYFRRLDEASDRVRVETIGESEEGREILLAIVSSEENLNDLERHAAAAAALADPRTTSRQEMETIVEGAVPLYHLLAGLHSTETGSPEMVMELAYRLAVSDTPEIRRIRDGVIVLITPVVEPDGRDRVVQWYYRHLRDRQGRMPYEDLREFGSPPYWGHYAYHDNNRDGIQLTLALTRAIHETFYRYRPVVLHDLHESLPLLYVSTGHGPYNRAIDPVTINEWTQMAHHEAGALQSEGLPGVWVWGFWDGWWPGYLFSVANNHHAVGRFYETFGNSLAGTFRRHLGETRYVGKPVVTRQWYRPSPPDSTVVWSLRNNTNYMQAGVLEALEYAALHGEETLRSFWGKGNRALERGRTEKPAAWVFPQEQRDPGRLAYLVNQLRRHRIEVHRTTADAAAGDSTVSAGSYVVRMDQPYRDAALMLLERQAFPEDEPNPPYDDVAWTLPLLYGVEARAVDEREVLDAPMVAVDFDVAPEGGVTGEGAAYLLADRGQSSLLAFRVRLPRHRIEAAEAAFEANDVEYPIGSWIVRGDREALDRVAAELGLALEATAEVPDVERHAVDLPRLAVWHPWTSTQDVGWVRYTLDEVGVPYRLISDDDLKRGDLEDRFDVILAPNVGGDFARLVHGIDPSRGPLAYTRTDDYPSHGVPNADDDITGGMGFRGLANLQRFVEEGGVLLAVGNAGRLAVDGGIVRRVGRPSGDFRTPGSELFAKVLRPEHPLTWGYEPETSVFRGVGPLWEVDLRHREWVVVQFGSKKVEDLDARDARYAEKTGTAGEAAPAAEEPPAEGPETGVQPPDFGAAVETPDGDAEADDADGADGEEADKDEDEAKDAKKDLVLSGFVHGKDVVDGQPAILDVPVGRGRVILFAFNPLHRYLNHSDFRFAFNAILHWNDLPRP